MMNILIVLFSIISTCAFSQTQSGDVIAQGLENDNYIHLQTLAHQYEVDLEQIKVTKSDSGFSINDKTGKTSPDILFQLGVRLGFPFFLGVDANLIKIKNKLPNYEVNFQAQTIGLVSSLNVGAAKYLGKKKQLGVGGRVHKIHAIDIFAGDTKGGYGFGPELIFSKQLNKKDNPNSRTFFSAQAGVVYIEYTQSLIPNASIGINFKIGK